MTSPENVRAFVNGHDKIRPEHLKRMAYIYLRQSTAGQVLHHRESQVNQERMADRALGLGWDPAHIHIIRSDLGQSGREADNRHGFQMLLSEVSLGHVGIIFGYEVSRFSRNNSDWYRLLEAAALFDTLIADYDGIYDLNLFNDRLLLGLKGTMSEAELHLIQLRLTAGRKRQLERGVYRQFLPTGYVRLTDGTVIQDPNDRVRQAFQLIFTKFRDLGSCRKLLIYLRQHDVLVPRRQLGGSYKGEILWKRPTQGALYEILTMPTYAGAFVYGRRQSRRGQTTRVRKPMEAWSHIHHNVYPAYITWEEYLANQKQLRMNRPMAYTNDASGPGRSGDGAALLQGLVLCGKCGHRMETLYKPHGRYHCEKLSRQFGDAKCGFVKASLVDQIVVQAFFEALQPAQLDALERVVAKHQQDNQQLRQAWHTRMQQATYEVQLAQRQYQAVDPENRLVAAELERRWEVKLRGFQETEAAYTAFENALPTLNLSPELCEQFRHICQRLPMLWPQLPHATQKTLLRSLISHATIHRHKQDQVEIKIGWISGHVSSYTTQVFIHRNQNVTDYDRLVERIEQLWQQNLHDRVIAQILTAEGFTSARVNRISSYTVQAIRMEKRWLRSSSPKITAPLGYTKVDDLAQRLGVQASWLYRCLREGRILPEMYMRHPKRRLILIRDEPSVIEKIQALKQT